MLCQTCAHKMTCLHQGNFVEPGVSTVLRYQLITMLWDKLGIAESINLPQDKV